MENFKGTMCERWEKYPFEPSQVTTTLKGVGVVAIGIECHDIALVYGRTDEKAIANAQLISKAPEMLDFINRISGEMLRSDFVLSETWYEQARELFKEATTI